MALAGVDGIAIGLVRLAQIGKMSGMKRVHEFEALRGFLALWVVIGHCFRDTGYMPKDLGHFGLLADPGFAVDVFIALSGFVIFDLVETKHEGYGPFITRRFFRI